MLRDLRERHALDLDESTPIRPDLRDTRPPVGRDDAERVDVTYHELSLHVGSGFRFWLPVGLSRMLRRWGNPCATSPTPRSRST